MICTRTDLSYYVSVLTKYMAHPCRMHWEVMKWLLRYLKHTYSEWLAFKKSKENVELLEI